MSGRRVAVLGGGITDAVVAGELGLAGGFDVHLLERAAELGGLHRSVGIDGAWYDAGCILFSTNDRFFQVFPEVLPLFVPITGRQGDHDYVSTLEAAEAAWKVARELIERTTPDQKAQRDEVAQESEDHTVNPVNR